MRMMCTGVIGWVGGLDRVGKVGGDDRRKGVRE